MADRSRSSNILVLLVEDDPADARLLVEVSKPYPVPIKFERVTSGDEALAHFARLESDPSLEEPDVVVLDLNLPGRDGRHVLSAMRSDPRLNRLPVIILTASPADADVLHAFNFKADAFLRKPVELADLAAAFERLEIGPPRPRGSGAPRDDEVDRSGDTAGVPDRRSGGPAHGK